MGLVLVEVVLVVALWAWEGAGWLLVPGLVVLVVGVDVGEGVEGEAGCG